MIWNKITTVVVFWPLTLQVVIADEDVRDSNGTKVVAGLDMQRQERCSGQPQRPRSQVPVTRAEKQSRYASAGFWKAFFPTDIFHRGDGEKVSCGSTLNAHSDEIYSC